MLSTKFKNWKGTEYEVKLKKPHKAQNAVGLCDYPEPDECNTILVDPHMKERWVMETIMHEMLHAYQWDLSEHRVNTLARSMTRVIYDLGGRIHFEYKDCDDEYLEVLWRNVKKIRQKRAQRRSKELKKQLRKKKK